MRIEQHAANIREQGYTVFPRLIPEADVEILRAAVLARLAEERPQRMWSETMVHLSDAVSTNITGVNFWRFFEERPELISLVLREPVLETLRLTLGEGFCIEHLSVGITDESRGFFPWHTHIGGLDDDAYPIRDGWPHVPTLDRITPVLYLNDTLHEDDGTLLMLPRRIGDAHAPEGDVWTEWPGQVEVRVPRGSVVIMEQCTWHAVRPMRRPMQRALIAGSFRAAHVPPHHKEAVGLRALAGRNALLDSVLPRESPGVAQQSPLSNPQGSKGVDATASRERTSEEIRNRSSGTHLPRVALEVEVSRRLQTTFAASTGWGLKHGWWEQDGLLLELNTPLGAMTLTLRQASPETRSFLLLDGVAYSYQGKLGREDAVVLKRFIVAVHPGLAAILQGHATPRQASTDSAPGVRGEKGTT